MLAFFLYNIILICMYGFCFGICLVTYLKKKDSFFYLLSILSISFLIQSIFMYVDHFIDLFPISKIYLDNILPILIIILCIICNYIFYFLSKTIINTPLKRLSFVLVSLPAIWMPVLFFYHSDRTNNFFFFLPNQLYLLYLGFCMIKASHERARTFYSKNFYIIATAVILSGITIFLEDAFDLFTNHFHITDRNFSRDLFAITICMGSSMYAIRFKLLNSRYPMSDTEVKNSFINTFDNYHKLTNREKEIFFLILDHKTNQEIADDLFLSVGTIKTHAHNIFKKLSIDNRIDLFSRYNIFYPNQSRKN